MGPSPGFFPSRCSVTLYTSFPRLPLPPQSGIDQGPQGALGLLLAPVPGGANGDRRAPAAGYSISVPESGEIGLPSTVQTVCDSSQTQDKFRALGRQRSTVGPCFEQPMEAHVSPHLCGFQPQHRVGGGSGGGGEGTQPRGTAGVPTGALYPEHPSSNMATPSPATTATQWSPHPSTGSSRGSHASDPEELPDTAPQGQQAMPVHGPWPLMDMAPSWPPGLV